MAALSAFMFLALTATAAVPQPEPEPVLHSFVKAESQICKSVLERQCQDPISTISASAGYALCWSKITGQTGGVVHHIWYKNNKKVEARELKVAGSPWRVWSKTVFRGDPKGDWRVEILDGAGVPIQTITFKVQ